MTSSVDWHYARWYPDTGLRLFNRKIDHGSASGRCATGVLLDASFVSGTTTDLARIFRYLPGDLLASEYVVTRSSQIEGPSQAAQEQGRIIREMVQKATSIDPVVSLIAPLASGDSLGSMELLELESRIERPPSAILNDLREIEIAAQLDWTEGVLETDRAHFELPAGSHADRFIRIGDLFTELSYIRRLADWIQGDVSHDSALIGDTWTLLPLLRELQVRAQLHFGCQIPVETFPAYPETAQITRMLEHIQARLTGADEARVLFILTVASSAFLLRNIRRYATRIWGDDIHYNVVILVDTRSQHSEDTSQQLDPFIHMEVERYDVTSQEECKLCRTSDRNDLLKIDPKKYRPILAGSVTPRMLTADLASKHSRLWEAANRTNAIRLHGTVQERHLEVHFDIESLLSDDRFRRQILGKLRDSVPLCDLAVIPQHSATDQLKRLVRSAYSDDTRILPVPRQPEAQEHRESLRSALQSTIEGVRQVLILDDAVVNGHTMRALHRFVQQTLTQSEHTDYEVHGFVVLARPISKGRWKRLQDSFLQEFGRMHLQAACEVWVPNREPCPWCNERDALEGLRSTIVDASQRRQIAEELELGDKAVQRLLKFLDSRIDRLSGPEGLVDSILLCRPDGTLAHREKPARLSPHSLFGDRLQETAAYTAVASAMQESRVEQPTEATTFKWNVPRILTAYHDPLLSAAFLRGAQSTEMMTSSLPGDFREALMEISFASTDGNPVFDQDPSLAAELLWAATVGTLPVSLRRTVRERVEPILRHCPGTVMELLDAMDWHVHGGGAIKIT